MRKVTILVILLLVAIFLFVSCDNNFDSRDKSKEDTTSQESQSEKTRITTPEELRGNWYVPKRGDHLIITEDEVKWVESDGRTMHLYAKRCNYIEQTEFYDNYNKDPYRYIYTLGNDNTKGNITIRLPYYSSTTASGITSMEYGNILCFADWVKSDNEIIFVRAN